MLHEGRKDMPGSRASASIRQYINHKERELISIKKKDVKLRILLRGHGSEVHRCTRCVLQAFLTKVIFLNLQSFAFNKLKPYIPVESRTSVAK